MRLYQFPGSLNVRRVLMTAIQLGIDLELVTVDLPKGAHKRPEFLRLNPAGRVPVLEDDGFVLTESCAIQIYLCERTPGQALYPHEVRARADVNRWLFWSAQHFMASIGLLNFEYVVKRFLGQTSDADAVAHGEALVAENAKLLDQHLAGRTWVSGAQLTIADLALAAPLCAIEQAKLPLTSATYPNLFAWLARIEQLDAWKQTLPR